MQFERTELLRAAQKASGADPDSDLETGLVAAIVRHLVLMRGSVPRAALVAEATQLLAPVQAAGSAEEVSSLHELVEGELEVLVGLGDLVLRQPARGARISVEPATPCFVAPRGAAGQEILLLGGSLDGRPFLPAHLMERIQVRGRVRWLRLTDDESLEQLSQELRDLGLQQADAAQWRQEQARLTPYEIASRQGARLSPCAPDLLSRLEPFDPGVSSSFFRAKLRAPNVERLRELCERHRWVAGLLTEEGGPRRYYLIGKLPDGELGAVRLEGTSTEARDAWLRLIAALGALAAGLRQGHPLQASVEDRVVHLYFPPPSWLECLLLLGRPRSATRGALRSDELSADVIQEVVLSLERDLFVEVVHR